MSVKEIPSTDCIRIHGGSGCGESSLDGELQELHAQSGTPLRFEDHNTSNVHTGLGYLVVGPGFRCTSPESRRRSHGCEASGVVAALTSNVSAYPLQPDSDRITVEEAVGGNG